MKPELTPKLTLNKETIRRLTDSELRLVAGGVAAPQLISTPCQTGNTSCCYTTQTTITISRTITCTEA